VACDLLVEEQGRVLVFETVTWPGDPFVERSVLGALKNPHVSIVTDTILLGFGLPSHLFYDAYPRWLGSYARDRGVVSLAEGIRRATWLPAQQLGIRDRGTIQVGRYADLVLFHERRLASRSTAQDPAHFPEGIHSVFINGRAVVDPDGFHPEPRPGRILRHGA
jgi:N-acyl-D-amino-acid deacylase